MGRCIETMASWLAITLVAGVVHADLMPIPVAELDVEGGAAMSAPSEAHGAVAPGLFLSLPGAFDTFSGSSDLPLDAASGEGAEPPSVLVLADRTKSFDLCLYALMGLGALRSGYWIRKSSLGFIPEWYHTSGPFRIGHSLAVNPDCVCPAAVYCFVQPTYTAADRIAQYRSGMIVSLWRGSQFTPDVLAARGPPVTC